MDQVVPWKALIEPYYPKGEGGRPAYPLLAMLRVHLMQNWFGYSDPAMEEALYETTILCQFAGLNLDRIPDETTILNFRRLLEKYELAGGILQVINGYLGGRGLMLRYGTIVDATIIHAPSSTKNKDKKRDSEMHQTKKGNQYFFGMKSHIGVDADAGLVHNVVGTPCQRGGRDTSGSTASRGRSSRLWRCRLHRGAETPRTLGSQDNLVDFCSAQFVQRAWQRHGDR
jgi:IS5 family transposase